MALEAREIKHGMAVTTTGSDTEWEVLDRHPHPAHWWLHRRTAAGEWETTHEHQRDLHAVTVDADIEALI